VRHYIFGSNVSFSVVLHTLRKCPHMRAARTGWNGKGMWVAIQEPDKLSKMTLPYLYMVTVTGDRIPWVVSHSDLLSDDWMIYDD